MDGLSRITDRIACDTERDAADRIVAAQADAHEKRLHGQKAAEARRAALVAAGRAEADELVRRTASAAELDARKALLAVKQELVTEAFTKALNRLLSLSEAEYRELLTRLAVNASRTGHEALMLNNEDRQRHGPAVIAAANQALADAGRPGALILSPEVIPAVGGLILKDGPVETNCTVEALVTQARNPLTPEVARLLFDA